MSIVPFPEKIRAPGQKISRAIVNKDSVEFHWDGKGGIHNIIAPASCIKQLIEKIEEAVEEGNFPCEESDPLSNYVGAKISKDIVQLNYDEDKTRKSEIISIKSLLWIKMKA